MTRGGVLLAAAAFCGALAAGVALADDPAEQQHLQLAGREIVIAAPKGSCALDPKNTREAPLITAMEQLQSARNKLLLRFVDCGELKQFRDGQRDGFAHHGMIMAVLQDGAVRPVEQASRRIFLDDVAKSLPIVDTDRLLDEVRSRLAAVSAGNGPGISAMQPLGVLDRDNDGLFIGFVVRGANPGSATLAVMGLTLVNRIALTLYLYQPFENAGDLKPLLTTGRAQLHDLLMLNGGDGDGYEIDWSMAAIAAGLGVVVLIVAVPLLGRRWRRAVAGHDLASSQRPHRRHHRHN